MNTFEVKAAQQVNCNFCEQLTRNFYINPVYKLKKNEINYIHTLLTGGKHIR